MRRLRSLAVTLACILAAGIARADDPADCDRLAAAPYDEHKVGDGVSRRVLATDAEAAIAACRAAVAANPNEPRFRYQLARALEAGGKDAEAVEWYDRVASSDYPSALADYAGMYALGKGVLQNTEKAFALAKSAAEAGNARGMFWMGVLYRDGGGVAQDYDAARSWFLKAADLGHADAMIALAGLYRDGRGVEVDADRALGWYERAATASGVSASMLEELAKDQVTAEAQPKSAEMAGENATAEGSAGREPGNVDAFAPMEPQSMASTVDEVIPDLVERVIDGVVDISTVTPTAEAGAAAPQASPAADSSGKGSGSGFVIDPSGIIATADSVVKDAQEIKVALADGSELPAMLVGRDERTDIALLKVTPKEPLKALGFGNSTQLRLGQTVVAIGNPFSLGRSVSSGIVSGLGRNAGIGPYDDFIQTDAAVNKGHAGGPLFNLQGEVIGMLAAILSQSGGSDGVAYAVPSSQTEWVLDQLKTYGEVRRGWLGVQIQGVTAEVATSLGMEKPSGAAVVAVQPGSPAEAGGVKVADVILSFDGLEVANMRALPRIVGTTEVGKTVDVEVWRDRAQRTLSVTIQLLADSSAAPPSAPETKAAPPAAGASSDAGNSMLAAAEAGDAEAMFKLGNAYWDGDGVKQDYAEAAKWFRKAADAGHPTAMDSLGWAYEQGQGVKQDYSQALSWYRKAAAAGDASGLNDVGRAYQFGNGVAQSYVEAANWYRKAADAGKAAAMDNLGVLYWDGHGVKQDYAEAVRWYRKGAEAGDGTSMADLGWAYEHGKGIARDYAEALKWYRKGVDAGDGASMYDIAAFFDLDRLGTRQFADAARYLIDAALKDNEPARTDLLGDMNGQWRRETRVELQRVLSERGVYTGALDGDIGPGTKRAIRQLIGG